MALYLHFVEALLIVKTGSYGLTWYQITMLNQPKSLLWTYRSLPRIERVGLVAFREMIRKNV